MQISEATAQFIRQFADADVRTLALQAHKYPNIDVPFAIQQIAGRKAVAEKIPSWYAVEGVLYPKHLSLEQCSSEATALYKSEIMSGDSLIDLTGGFGIDCAFLSAKFSRVDYVEQNEELCRIAAHNFTKLGLGHIRVHVGDAADFLAQTPAVDAIFIDPARRNRQGGKTVLVSDCEPDVAMLSHQLLSKATRVMVKLSPMLDLTLALQALPQTTEAHIVSVGNECKELLLILEHDAQQAVKIHCVNLTKSGDRQHFVFTKEQELERVCRYADKVECYLYEPNSSLMKSGGFKSIAAQFNLNKLHSNSHLYTSDEKIDHFPGRIFCVKSLFSLNKSELKESLRGIDKANIAVRNFPVTVDELRKRLKLADGGEHYLFATTLANDRKVLILCAKPD